MSHPFRRMPMVLVLLLLVLYAVDVHRKSLDTALTDACVTLQAHQILLPSAVLPPCLVAYATIVHHLESGSISEKTKAAGKSMPCLTCVRHARFETEIEKRNNVLVLVVHDRSLPMVKSCKLGSGRDGCPVF